MKHVHLTVLAAALVMASGCGHNVLQASTATARTASGAAAKAVAPDDPAVLADDVKKANYWVERYGGDANLVMSIQTTALNTQKISTAANVFFSPEGFYASKPCVFVSRHYFTKGLSQQTEISDYTRLAAGLHKIGDYSVKTAAAWSLAHGWQPIATACAPNTACPTPAPAGKAFFTSSRAMLIQGATNPVWELFADGHKYEIDAVANAITAHEDKAANPNDPLDESGDADLQRASAIWLPTNPMQPNTQAQPQ